MQYSLTLREEEFCRLREIVFDIPHCEGAAYLLCGESRTDQEIRLLVREVIPVYPHHYRVRQSDFLSIDSPSYVQLAKRARLENLSLVFVHSHPGGDLAYSEQDNREEKRLQAFFQARIPCRLHGSAIVNENGVIGRVFDNEFRVLERIRIIGTRFTFFDREKHGVQHQPFFDRQVLAFGADSQALLKRLHIGVVGVGGTGSSVVEQLTRLGVGTLTVFDGDSFDLTNVNRVYGSSTKDVGRAKVAIAKKHIDDIGLGTTIHVVADPITSEAVAKQLRVCDVIFGCTDKEAPRAILVNLALRYLIPVFDLGVVIHSQDGLIRDIIGRVTTLIPGEACLFCKRRITPETIRLEGLSAEERRSLAREGYVPELGIPNPSVVPFTTGIASLAVTELLHRLTGFMGAGRAASEVLCSFDQTRLRTNRPLPDAGCLCAQRNLWGTGDRTPFLDSTWAI